MIAIILIATWVDHKGHISHATIAARQRENAAKMKITFWNRLSDHLDTCVYAHFDVQVQVSLYWRGRGLF
jgi:hypothetical protein